MERLVYRPNPREKANNSFEEESFLALSCTTVKSVSSDTRHVVYERIFFNEETYSNMRKIHVRLKRMTIIAHILIHS